VILAPQKGRANTLKAKYGFIAFSDPEDFLKAWKENDGKYIGNRPIRLSKVKDDKYGSIATVTVSGRKVGPPCRLYAQVSNG
jgi:RNA recognition motif-containing protein